MSLGGVYQDSDSKVTSLLELKKTIEANPYDLATQVEQWEENNKEVLAAQRCTIMGGFFNNPITKTQEAVQKIKEALGLVKVEAVGGFGVGK